MTLKGFVYGLLLAAIPAFLAWYLTRSTPDVRYSLSEQIPVSFANSDGKNADDKTPEIVQQLEVKNVGNLKAENVLVKIHGDIKDHMLNKHSAADEPKATALPRSLEVLYPALPPEASFRLSFKSSGDGIQAKEVSVSHNHGQGREALSKSTSSPPAYVMWSVVGLYLLFIVQFIRSSIIAMWKMGKADEPVDKIVSSKRPFYMSDKGWTAAVVEILKEKMRKAAFLDRKPKDHPSYQFLQIDRPAATFDEASWRTCTELAIESLERTYARAIETARWEERILDLLKTEKPKNFQEPAWVELETQASQRYEEVRKKSLLVRTADDNVKCLQETKPERIKPESWERLREHWQQGYVLARKNQFYSKDEASRCLRETRPAVIPAPLWDNLRGYWEKEYFDYITDDLLVSGHPHRYATHVDKNLLTEAHKQSFEWRLRLMMQGEAASIKARLLKDMIESVLDKGTAPTEKPGEVEEHEWKSIKRIEKQVQDLRDVERSGKENSKKASELVARETELEARRERVERQLRFIDELLRDPTAIDRVEEYNATFAVGNLENLRKLATQQRKLAQAKARRSKSSGQGEAEKAE